MIPISQETYRHWKAVLPPLRRDGRGGPCFSVGDLLAVAIVHRTNIACHVPASAFKAIANELFKACNSTGWLTLENKYLIIDLTRQRLQFSQVENATGYDTPRVVVPLRPIVEDLRDALLTASEPTAQEVLRLPRTALPSHKKRASERTVS